LNQYFGKTFDKPEVLIQRYEFFGRSLDAVVARTIGTQKHIQRLRNRRYGGNRGVEWLQCTCLALENCSRWVFTIGYVDKKEKEGN